jgi:hypothetical protein
MFSHTLKFGFLGSIICALWFYGNFYFGINPYFSFWANLVIVLVGVTAFSSIYFYAKKLDNFSFGQGLAVGGLTVLISGLITMITLYILGTYIIPNAVEIYKNESLAHLVKNKESLIKDSSPKVYKAYLESIPQINAWNSAFRYFLSNIIIPGLMFSILSSLPLRKKKSDATI